MLKLKPVVFIGVISYSLYLWHWPILVLWQQTQVVPLNMWQVITAVILSIVMGYLSYRFVETPFRKGASRYKLWNVFMYGGASMALIGGVGLVIALKDGFPHRYSPEVNTVLDRFAGSDLPAEACTTRIDPARYETDPDGCRFGDMNANTTVAILGDSHANVYVKILNELGEELGIGLINMMADGCSPIVDSKAKCQRLSVYNEEYMKDISTIDTVILTTYWVARLWENDGVLLKKNSSVFLDSVELKAETLREKLVSMVEKWREQGMKIIISYPVPEPSYDVPNTMAFYMVRGLDINELYVPYDEFKTRTALATRILDSLGDDIVRIYPEKYLCDGNKCNILKGQKPYYYDDDHLSRFGANLMRKGFERALLQR